MNLSWTGRCGAGWGDHSGQVRVVQNYEMKSGRAGQGGVVGGGEEMWKKRGWRGKQQAMRKHDCHPKKC